MDKKRVVTSLDKITPEIRDLIAKQYPLGWKDRVFRINKPNGEFFHAITLDTPETAYLIKVPVKVDSKADLDKEDEKGYSVGDSDDDDTNNQEDIADDTDEA
ncbi:MAG: hypothetical protein KQI35_02770 [Bacteroidetes bacterium]|nr:hypothetical protein [Bacteroidota bacterium]